MQHDVLIYTRYAHEALMNIIPGFKVPYAAYFLVLNIPLT